ncbi:hypothetical protein GGTG_00122 [Gaeumannomyces tritici R3-111a-1]|uniref:MARVEL domain-containing protein n=1 Tax=Gaeumannomyces tritici (strain R3-111a-1) TaxID=644352 RepID=J3NFS8_GAET3|nr:hypothetical protein GGTG_00122 [Gaeumannomyces tritici R3-111a-1]EJT80118.1 hypothetical protein GGTG_00122 [Gaeumannomyces tritici R3-111a-1]
MLNLVALGLRGFMFLAAAVVLGLSVTLAKHQVVGGPPAETSFASFTGGFGVFAAAVGIAAIFFEAIPSLVPLALDGLSALFFLAGGIALTMAMKDVSCTSTANGQDLVRYLNKILNGGCYTPDNCGVNEGFRRSEDLVNELKGRCVRVQADFSFQYIAFVAALACLVVTFLSVRRSGTRVFA